VDAYETVTCKRHKTWLEGALDVDHVVTHVLPLESAAAAFELLTSENKKAGKNLACPLAER
jgi:threonine dehydrogenase-like Zn-dependent dehydrogenase